MTDEFRSQEAVVQRLRHMFVPIADALVAGIGVARTIHTKYRWAPSADEHLFPHLVRREAVEHLRPFHPRAVDQGGLGLPMSGLVLHLAGDVVRIWRSRDGEIPPVASEQKRDFLRQMPGQLTLDEVMGNGTTSDTDEVGATAGDDATGDEQQQPVCNTVLLWDTDRERLTRLVLVLTQPAEDDPTQTTEVWRFDVLRALGGTNDLPGYDRRREAPGESDEETGSP